MCACVCGGVCGCVCVCVCVCVRVLVCFLLALSVITSLPRDSIVGLIYRTRPGTHSYGWYLFRLIEGLSKDGIRVIDGLSKSPNLNFPRFPFSYTGFVRRLNRIRPFVNLPSRRRSYVITATTHINRNSMHSAIITNIHGAINLEWQ